ncbi:unnamed protein product [Owenia fusiformis]|uniref:Uncharacterized protein n=1 Tax=Owenia fusiformis TaxID=6347 RepID=A0A8J1TTZ2_OWEFU|nr:unnamed protein product [Owenia fusiformis]
MVGPTVFFWICLAIVPFACFGNIVLLIALWRYPKLRHQSGSNVVFTVALAGSNLVTTTVMFPLKSIGHFIDSDLRFNPTACLLGCQMLSFTGISSGFILGCIAFEKYIKILHPFLNSSFTTQRCLIIVCIPIMLWGFFSFAPAFGWNLYTPAMKETYRCDKVLILPIAYVAIIEVWIGIIFLQTVYCYGMIFYAANQHQRQIIKDQSRFPTLEFVGLYKKEHENIEFLQSKQQKKCKMHPNCSKTDCHLKIVKTAIIILGMYFLVWIPALSLPLVMSIKKNNDDIWIYMTLHYCCFILILLQACINPVIYTYRMKTFRRAFQKILLKNNIKDLNDESNTCETTPNLK